MNTENYPICLFTQIQAKRVIWEMTSRCTRTCSYCFIPPERRRQQDPSLKSLIRAMDLLKTLGYTDIQVTGGEFFLRKDAVDILREMHARGLTIAISTNGDLLTDKILNEIMNFSIRSINLSLDSHRASINDSARGPKGFENTLKVIEACRQYPIRIRIQSVLTPQTKDHIHELPFFLDSLGISLHIIAAQFPHIEPYEKDFAHRFLTTICQLPHMKIIPLRIRLHPGQMPMECKICSSRGSLLHISPSGDLTECPLALSSTFPEVNIFTQEESSVISSLHHYNSQPLQTIKPLCLVP